MKEKEYLPGNISERVRELREERGLTRKELAQLSGVNESLLGRIENGKIHKIQDDALQKLAKFFSVSADFLLGLTDIPDRKNYDIEELGLSIGAARNLYTGEVNTQVVNLLLADPDFAALSNRIADYFDETMAAGYAARNQLYTSISALVGRIGNEKPEMKGAAKKTACIVRSLRTPLYDNELTQIQTEFMAILRRIKDELPSRIADCERMTRTAFDQTVQHFVKDGEVARITAVSEEEFAEQFKLSLSELPEISEQLTDDLLASFFAIARVLALKKNG